MNEDQLAHESQIDELSICAGIWLDRIARGLAVLFLAVCFLTAVKACVNEQPVKAISAVGK